MIGAGHISISDQPCDWSWAHYGRRGDSYRTKFFREAALWLCSFMSRLYIHTLGLFIFQPGLSKSKITHLKYFMFRPLLLIEMRVMKLQQSKKIVTNLYKLQSYALILTNWTKKKLIKDDNILVLKIVKTISVD